MAKIALISKQMTHQVITLAKGLAGQRHEVQIITSYRVETDFFENGNNENNKNIEILAYFRRWSWFESLRLLPRFLNRPPEVFHFFFESESDRPRGAHQALSLFAHQIKRPTIISVGNSKIQTSIWKNSSLFATCRALIAPSRETLMYLKRQGLIGRDVATEVILPFNQDSKNTSESQSSRSSTDNFEKQCKRWQPYILIPSQAKKDLTVQLIERTKKAGLRLVFLGPRSERVFSDMRFTSLANTSDAEKEFLTKNSSAVLLATHEYEPSELMQWQKVASQYETPIIALRRQTEAVPGLCQHEKNGFIFEHKDHFFEEFRRLLETHPRLQIPNYLRRSDSLVPADQSLNEISRLYVRAMT